MATLDWIDVPTGIRAINANASANALDDRVQSQITAISLIGDDLVGPVVRRTVTAERHTGGAVTVLLRRRPVYSVTTVREVASPGTIDTLSAVAWGGSGSGYQTTPYEHDETLLSGKLRRVSAGSDYCWPTGDSVEVTYSAGRYATTSVVSPRFQEAASAALRRLWKREAGAWAQAVDVFAQLDPDTTPGSGFFNAVEPVMREMLAVEVQHHVGGFA